METRGAGEDSEQLWKLLRDSLKSASDYSRKLRFGLSSLAEQFEAGDIAPALPKLSSILEGINWLIGVYDRCRFFLAAPIRVEEESIVQSKLLEALKHLVALVEDGDMDGAAWITRNELTPRVETLILRIEELSRRRIAPQ